MLSMPFLGAVDMNASDDLIRRVVSRSGIVTSKGRLDLERELHAHLEDAIEDARSQGCDEAGILQMVWERFGDPDEIAREFAAGRRLERRALFLAYSLVWMGISMLIVAGLILGLQLLLAICSGIAPSHAFPHLRDEIISFASLVLGYTGLYLEERLFQKRRLIKAFAMNIALFALLFTFAFLGLHLTTLAPVLAFVSGVAVRVMQQTVIRPVWFLGTAIPMVAAGLLASTFGNGNSHFLLGTPALIRWSGLTVACYFLTLLSRKYHAGSADFAGS
jgi:hypothetical protein